MGSRSTQPATATTKMTLTPVMTLENQKDSGDIRSVAYFLNGRRIISASFDRKIRQWDLQAGKEVEEADVYKGSLAEVSRDGRWLMTTGGDEEYNLRAYEIETGIVKKFQDPRAISCIDISADGKLLASGCGMLDVGVLVWGIDTGVADFGSDEFVGALRFSPDAKKLAIGSNGRKCLEVWDVQTQKLDARVGKKGYALSTRAPHMFWTEKGTILAVFSFDDDGYDSDSPFPTRFGIAQKQMTVYEFDASTLETVGDPFEGHTDTICDLALSSDGTLLASSSRDKTIKLWAFEPRHLLASFDVLPELVHPYSNTYYGLTFSPDIHQLAYSVDHKIFICNIPPDILARIRLAPDAQAIDNAPDNSTLNVLLNSDATRRPANVRRNPATSPMIPLPPGPLQPIHTRGLQQPVFFRHLRNLISFSSHIVPPVQNSQHRDPLDIPATSSRIDDHTPVAHTTQGHSHSDLREHPRRTEALPTTRSTLSSPATLRTLIQHLSHWWPIHASHPQPPIVDVALAPAQLRHAAAGAPNNDEDLIPDEYFDSSSQNPDSQQPSAAAQIDIGEHGRGRSCFCF